MANDLLLQLVIKAVDLATKDLDAVNAKVKELGATILQSEFKSVGDDMQSFGEAVKNATDPLAQATAKTLALNTALVGMASVLGVQAYESAKSYEVALADLAKVLDGGMEAAKGYGARLNETASRFAQNGQQLVGAMANFVQAGYDAEEAFRLVTESTKLMIAGDLEAAQSSELLVSILKGFKVEASAAGAVVDMLNQVSNQYATDVKQLATGMAALSPIAKQMGFSMEETAGLLTPIIEVYRSGSEAADALKTSLQQLTADTAPVKAALASIGVSQTDLNGALRNGKDIFLDVARAFTGLSDAQKAYLTQELVGIEQAGRFGTVLNSLGDYLKVTNTALTSAGSAMQEVNVRLNTAEATSQKAEESFRQLSVTLGNAFKPQIQGVVAATGDLVAAFDRSIKAGDLAPLLNVLKPQIAAVENLVRAMANNLEEALAGVDWRPLADGLKAVSKELGEAFGQLMEGMDLTTVEGLRAFLQDIINLLGNFTQFIGGAVDGLGPFIGALNTLFTAVSQNSPELARLAGEVAGLMTSANQILPVLSQVGSTLFGAVGQIAELALKIGLLVAAMKLLSAAGIPVVEILGNLARAFFALNPAVASAVTALTGFPGLTTALIAGAGALGAGIGTLINRFVEWASGGQSVGSMLYDLVDKITGTNDAITRSVTPEELAIARAERLALAKQQQAQQTEAVAKAEEEARRKAEEAARAQENQRQGQEAHNATIARLKESFKALGLVYDETTGQILRQGEATAKQQQESLALGQSLDKLGLAANFMKDRITQAGQETIATFRQITQNAQATAPQIEAAFRKAISSAATEAEVKKILEAYQEWAAGAKKGTADVAAATEAATQKNKELRQSVEEVSPAIRALIAAGADEIEIKKTQAIQSGNFTEFLRLETEQRKKAEAATLANADASYADAEAKKKEAEASREAAEAAQKVKQAEEARQSASQAATTAMNNALAAVQALGGDTDKLTARFAELQRTTGGAVTSMTDWMAGTAGAVREVTQEYKGQQSRLDQLTATLQHFAATGEYTSEVQRAMAAAAGDAGNQFSLLDQEDLGNLRAALDSAKQKLEEMGQATEDARQKLAGMNAELLEAKGEDQKAKLLRQQIDYQERLAEIETQRREAELLGNTQLVAILDQQAQVLRQINDTKVASIQSDQSAEQAGDKVARSWQGAEGAIRSAGTALAETHRTATNLANVNLDGLVAGLKGAAGHAQLLRDTL